MNEVVMSRKLPAGSFLYMVFDKGADNKLFFANANVAILWAYFLNQSSRMQLYKMVTLKDIVYFIIKKFNVTILDNVTVKRKKAAFLFNLYSNIASVNDQVFIFSDISLLKLVPIEFEVDWNKVSAVLGENIRHHEGIISSIGRGRVRKLRGVITSNESRVVLNTYHGLGVNIVLDDPDNNIISLSGSNQSILNNTPVLTERAAKILIARHYPNIKEEQIKTSYRNYYNILSQNYVAKYRLIRNQRSFSIKFIGRFPSDHRSVDMDKNKPIRYGVDGDEDNNIFYLKSSSPIIYICHDILEDPFNEDPGSYYGDFRVFTNARDAATCIKYEKFKEEYNPDSRDWKIMRLNAKETLDRSDALEYHDWIMYSDLFSFMVSDLRKLESGDQIKLLVLHNTATEDSSTNNKQVDIIYTPQDIFHEDQLRDMIYIHKSTSSNPIEFHGTFYNADRAYPSNVLGANPIKDRRVDVQGITTIPWERLNELPRIYFKH